MDRDGTREDGVADAGAPEVADAELHAGDAAVAGRHVRPHARQPLRYHRRHAAVQHLERLAAGGRDEEAAGEPRRRDLFDLEAEGVERRVQLRRLGVGARRRRGRGVAHGAAPRGR